MHHSEAEKSLRQPESGRQVGQGPERPMRNPNELRIGTDQSRQPLADARHYERRTELTNMLTLPMRAVAELAVSGVRFQRVDRGGGLFIAKGRPVSSQRNANVAL